MSSRSTHGLVGRRIVYYAVATAVASFFSVAAGATARCQPSGIVLWWRAAFMIAILLLTPRCGWPTVMPAGPRAHLAAQVLSRWSTGR
jgi:hypothetical protein